MMVQRIARFAASHRQGFFRLCGDAPDTLAGGCQVGLELEYRGMKAGFHRVRDDAHRPVLALNMMDRG